MRHSSTCSRLQHDFEVLWNNSRLHYPQNNSSKHIATRSFTSARVSAFHITGSGAHLTMVHWTWPFSHLCYGMGDACWDNVAINKGELYVRTYRTWREQAYSARDRWLKRRIRVGTVQYVPYVPRIEHSTTFFLDSYVPYSSTRTYYVRGYRTT